MKVIATPGLQCPKEGKPREYINDSEAIDVPDSAYYRRLVHDGSLVEVEAKTMNRDTLHSQQVLENAGTRGAKSAKEKKTNEQNKKKKAF